MNGDNLIISARKILKDLPSDYQKGEFWDDKEIIIALNAAQDIFVNNAINSGKTHLLNSLLRSAGLNTGLISAQIPDYFHYASCEIGANANRYIAKLYIGTEGCPFLQARNYCAVIIGDNIYFVNNGDPTGTGELYYYIYPTYIGATSLGDDSRPDFNITDFSPDIYSAFIVKQACVILGFKEIQSQRDFKQNFRDKLMFQFLPPEDVTYLNVRDKYVNPRQAQAAQARTNGNQQ